MIARLLKILLTVGGVLGLMLLVNPRQAAAASRTATVHYQTQYQGRQYNKAGAGLPAGGLHAFQEV